jgi:hypothetical protein
VTCPWAGRGRDTCTAGLLARGMHSM